MAKLTKTEKKIGDAIITLTKAGYLKWAHGNISGSVAHAVLEVRLCEDLNGESDDAYLNLIDTEDTLYPVALDRGAQKYLLNIDLDLCTPEVELASTK